MLPPTRKTLFEIPGCIAVQLDTQAIPSIQVLLEKCNEFHILVTGLPVNTNESLELFTDLPPGKMIDDKTMIGFYKGSDLIGILDSIKGYPGQEEWYIGLMLLDPAERGNGLGRRLVDAYEFWAASSGVKAVLLGVVEENQRGLNFWQQCGYQLVDKRPPRRIGNKDQAVYIFSKVLPRVRTK